MWNGARAKAACQQFSAADVVYGWISFTSAMSELCRFHPNSDCSADIASGRFGANSRHSLARFCDQNRKAARGGPSVFPLMFCLFRRRPLAHSASCASRADR